MLNRTTPLLAASTVMLVGLATPRLAQACGGTFCDNTAIPMPVDQAGEDILFVQDGPDIEVHVRIEYEGEAERFAWIVPIQAVPEVRVGSELLFTQLAAATAPRWIHQRSEECPEPSSGGFFIPEDDFAAASEPDEPEIVFSETVGAFEVVVLQGGSAAELVEFLADNGYAQDPAATPIVQEYLDEGFLFAAVKLSAGASADAIHPLVFRFPGDEPCVPIRLTRIAAEQDMGIRAYFLGQHRWAPQNYLHVVLNPLAYPWVETSTIDMPAYLELLTLAVDLAGGRAFATEYAGPSDVVLVSGVYSPSWDEAAFAGLDMVAAIDAIAIQGLAGHPLIQALLLEFMPPPDGVDPQLFWNDIAAYADLVDIHAWDSIGFADALAERIIEPGFHAVELLDTWPVLTRLHTTMSPHEMIVDPMFHAVELLGDVDNVVTASGLDRCGELGSRYTIPFEGEPETVCLAEPASEWPAVLRGWPVLRVERIPSNGPPQVLEDRRAKILASLAEQRAASPCETDDPGSGESGEEPEGTSGDGPAFDDGSSKAGCGCRSDDSSPSPASAWASLVGLFALGWARRRRRPARA
jgi:MYXO-CTERM domain-containing protein